MGLDVAKLLDHAGVAVEGLQARGAPIKQNPGAMPWARRSAPWPSTAATRSRSSPRPPLEALGPLDRTTDRREHRQGKAGASSRSPVSPSGKPESYGNDRVFVQVRTAGEPAGGSKVPELMALSEAGHPVIDLVLVDPIDIGAEFFRWEIATPLAGKVIGIKPVRPAQRPGEQGQHQGPAGSLQGEGGPCPTLETVATLDGLTLRRRRREQGPSSSRPPARGPGATCSPPSSRPTSPGSSPATTWRSPNTSTSLPGAGPGDPGDPPPHPRRPQGRHHHRLRPPVPPLDRATPQGRVRRRGLPPTDRRRRGRPADPGLPLRVRHVGQGPGPWATSNPSPHGIAGPSTSTLAKTSRRGSPPSTKSSTRLSGITPIDSTPRINLTSGSAPIAGANLHALSHKGGGSKTSLADRHRTCRGSFPAPALSGKAPRPELGSSAPPRRPRPLRASVLLFAVTQGSLAADFDPGR